MIYRTAHDVLILSAYVAIVSIRRGLCNKSLCFQTQIDRLSKVAVPHAVAPPAAPVRSLALVSQDKAAFEHTLVSEACRDLAISGEAAVLGGVVTQDAVSRRIHDERVKVDRWAIYDDVVPFVF